MWGKKMMLWGCMRESSFGFLVFLQDNYKRIKKDSWKKANLSPRVQFVNNMKRSEKVACSYHTKCFIVLQSSSITSAQEGAANHCSCTEQLVKNKSF